MIDLGRFCLLLSCFLSGYAVVVDILGSRRKDRVLIDSARNATNACLACLSVAMAALWTLLITSDFSVLYVVDTWYLLSKNSFNTR